MPTPHEFTAAHDAVQASSASRWSLRSMLTPRYLSVELDEAAWQEAIAAAQRPGLRLSAAKVAPTPTPEPELPVTVEAGREAAALEVVRGYERALTALHPDDAEEREWLRDRLRAARAIAGLGRLGLVPPPA